MLRAVLSRFETDRSEYARHIALLTLVLAAVGSFVFLSGPQVVPIGADTTSQWFILLTSYLAMIVSLTGYRLLTDEQDKISKIEKLAQRQARSDWMSRFIVSVAVTWILSTVCQAVFVLVIGQVLANAELPRLVMMLLFAVYGAALGFVVAFFIVGVDDVEINWLLVILGVGGILFCTTIVANPLWWKRSVSALGIDSGSGTFFNITVIVLGLIALTLGRDLIADLKLLMGAKLFPVSGFNVIRFGLTAIGVGIVGAGLFPTEGLPFSHALHLLFSHVMALLCIFGMLLLSPIAPAVYSRRFIYFSRILGAISILVILANAVNLLLFAPMELILFGTAGLWVFFFRVQTKVYVRQQVIAEIRRELSEARGLGREAILNKWFMKYPDLVAEATGHAEGAQFEQPRLANDEPKP